MKKIFAITQEERIYLRELAKKYLELANLQVMEERQKLWYSHNALKGVKPVIVMEYPSFADDITPALKCISPDAQEIEKNLILPIVNHELIDDDKVISPYYTVYWKIDIIPFGVNMDKTFAEDKNGKKIGFSQKHPISDLSKDFEKIKSSTYTADKEYTLAWKKFVEEIIGDILPVKIKNFNLYWHCTPSQRIVELMGLENMMFAMYDTPDEMHELYRFVKDDIMAFVKWQEDEGLLVLNNHNDYAGAGSYGFTDELPTDEYKKTNHISPKDIWINLNSQETVGVSPDMFGEFTFPAYYELAKEFGMAYYGCCEPVHDIWEKYISKLNGLRKVSISPWCNEEYMGQALAGGKVIYSRKPSPNFIGVEGSFDEAAFEAHITKTLNAAKGCELEFIFRDIYTLSGDLSKPGRAVKIVRNLINSIW